MGICQKNMKKITFFDLEVSTNGQRILDIGAYNSDNLYLHTQQIHQFKEFIKDSKFFCGHNIIKFDLNYLKDSFGQQYNNYFNIKKNVIDTLFWSALMFPKHPYHNLVKDDKLDTDVKNNPVNDAKKSGILFIEEVQEFKKLPNSLQRIYYGLLSNREEFSAFFRFLDFHPFAVNVEKEIKNFFKDKICSNISLINFIALNPIELSYALALIYSNDRQSITPPWILKNYPDVTRIISRLRNTPCAQGCVYCNENNNSKSGLRLFFGYDEYRDFNGIPLQKQAVEAALAKKSLLAIFPTGEANLLHFRYQRLWQVAMKKG